MDPEMRMNENRGDGIGNDAKALGRLQACRLFLRATQLLDRGQPPRDNEASAGKVKCGSR